MRLRIDAGEAAWPLRVAARKLRESVASRGFGAVKAKAAVAVETFERVQRAVQTRVAWPLADTWRERGALARAGLATGLIVTALAAGASGALLGASGEKPAPTPIKAQAPAPAPIKAPAPAQSEPVLQGVAPDFKSDPVTIRVKERALPAPVPSSGEPLAVARRFAEAFVAYEIGQGGDEITRAFRSTTAPRLRRSLGDRPPRLPEAARVPRAKVMNVLAGPRRGRELEVSVALSRLRAVSELRLTLRRRDNGWLVSEVRG
jgi:hypothetical protein